MFKDCEICGNVEWSPVYEGNIRDGAYGNNKENAKICECRHCGVQRLAEKDCIPPEYYDTGEYRKKLEQSLTTDSALYEQDQMQKFTAEAIGGWQSLRNKSIIDVGCGVGSILDLTKGVVNKQVGIEPCTPYRESLIKRGQEVYSDLGSQKGRLSQKFDYALSIQVIEHVINPVTFLKDIYCVLKRGGEALISTPNRDDILFSLVPEFQSFFFRTAHRWYFDKSSLENCAKAAGFEVLEIKFLHRYGMSNAIHWLRDKMPKGNAKIMEVSGLLDNFWRTSLETSGQSDNLFIHLKAGN